MQQSVQQPSPVPSHARKFGSLELSKPSQLSQRRGKVLVIGGRSNAGKTTLLKTLWDSRYIKTVLVADCRGRTHVLPDLAGLDICELKTGKDQKVFRDALVENPHAYDAVVIDTYSEYQGIDLKYRNLYGAEDRQRMKIYGESHMDMADVTRTIYDLATQYGTHVILTTWLKETKDDKTGVEQLKLYLTNTFEEYLRGIVDYVGVLELDTKPLRPYPPVLSFEVSNTTPQKFSPAAGDEERSAARLPKKIYKPSLGHIIDTLCGEEWPKEQHLP